MAVTRNQRAAWEEELTRFMRLIREKPLGWPWQYDIGPLHVIVNVYIQAGHPNSYVVSVTHRGRGRKVYPMPRSEYCADLLELRVWITLNRPPTYGGNDGAP